MRNLLVITALVLATASSSFASSPQPPASRPATSSIHGAPSGPAIPRAPIVSTHTDPPSSGVRRVASAPEPPRSAVQASALRQVPGVSHSASQDFVADHAAVRQDLRVGAIVAEQKNADHGINPSRIVKIARPDGVTVEAIMKPAAGGHASARIDPKTMGIREAAASSMADSLGLDFVPPTTLREHDGKLNSVQLMVRGTTTALKLVDEKPGAQLDRESAEKVRVFDYLTGNIDRHPNNLLVEERDGRYFPVAIDNGLTFPVGPTKGSFFWPKDLTSTHRGPLLPSTVAFIQGIDTTKLAGVLKGAGIEREATVHVLRRVEHLKREPNLLAMPDKDKGKYQTVLSLANHPTVALKALKWDGNTLVPVGKEAHKPTQELPPETISEIDRIVDATYR